jgi:hypothetical protein
MPLAIKQFSSDTNSVTPLITLYTVPAGRVAKVDISNLQTNNASGSKSIFRVGNLDLPENTTYGITGGAGLQPPRPLVYHLGAGQSVVVVRTGVNSTECRVQFVAIEEAAA